MPQGASGRKAEPEHQDAAGREAAGLNIRAEVAEAETTVTDAADTVPVGAVPVDAARDVSLWRGPGGSSFACPRCAVARRPPALSRLCCPSHDGEHPDIADIEELTMNAVLTLDSTECDTPLPI